MPRCLFEEGLAAQMWAYKEQPASTCQLLQGLLSCRERPPLKVMHLPGQPTLSKKWVWKPSYLAQHKTPLRGHPCSRTPSQVSQGFVKPESQLGIFFFPVLLLPLLFLLIPQKTITDPKLLLSVFFWIIQPAVPHNTSLLRTACEVLTWQRKYQNTTSWEELLSIWEDDEKRFGAAASAGLLIHQPVVGWPLS